ncbi:MAG TPA: TolC family protein [Ignavibacteria bacterium]
MLSKIDIYSQPKNLNYYIDNAIITNQVINENRKLITTFDIRKELINSSLNKPKIYSTVNYLFAPSFGEFGYDSAVTNGGLYSALVNLELPLFNGFTSRTKLQEALNEQNTYKNNIITTEHEIFKNVTDLYIKAYQDYEQISTADETLRILDLQREIINAMIERGIGKFSDLKLLDVEYQTQVINKNQLEMVFEKDLMDLNLIAGIRDTSTVELDKPDIKLAADKSLKSYFLESFLLDSLKLITEKDVNESNYKPQLSFFINGGLNAVNYTEIWKKVGMSTGINMTFSIYDGNQKELNNYLIDIRGQNISYQKNYFVYQNEIRKKNILKELSGQEKLLSQQEKQLENYQSLLELYRNLFVSGEVSLLEYINILKNYISFKNEIIINKNQQLIIINEYNYWNW